MKIKLGYCHQCGREVPMGSMTATRCPPNHGGKRQQFIELCSRCYVPRDDDACPLCGQDGDGCYCNEASRDI